MAAVAGDHHRSTGDLDGQDGVPHLGPLARHAGDQAHTDVRAEEGIRARHAIAPAPGSGAEVGGRGEHPAAGCGQRRRSGLRHAVQPLAGRHSTARQPVHSGLGRLEAAPGRGGHRSARLPDAPHVDQPHSAAVPPRSRPAGGGRRAGNRIVRRHARRAGIRPAAGRDQPHHAGQSRHGPAGAVRLVVDASHRDHLGNAHSARHGGTAALRRMARAGRKAHARRSDDVPRLPA